MDYQNNVPTQKVAARYIPTEEDRKNDLREMEWKKQRNEAALQALLRNKYR